MICGVLDGNKLSKPGITRPFGPQIGLITDDRPLKVTMVSESPMKVTFIGDKRGAGLSVAGVHDWQGIKRYRFNAADSKDIQATMSSIRQYEKLNPDAVVNK